jgi:hypothetical protein
MIIFCLKIKSLIHSCTFSPFLGLHIKTSQQLSQASAGWIKLECISHVVCQPIFCVITRSWVRESFQHATDVRAKRPCSPPSQPYDGYQVISGEAEWLRHVINHPPPTSTKVKERVKLPSWKVTGWNLLHLLQISKQQTMHTYKLYLAAISKSGILNMTTCDIWMGSLYVTTDLGVCVCVCVCVCVSGCWFEICQSIVLSQPKCSPLVIVIVRDFIPVVFRLMQDSRHKEHFKA